MQDPQENTIVQLQAAGNPTCGDRFSHRQARTPSVHHAPETDIYRTRPPATPVGTAC